MPHAHALTPAFLLVLLLLLLYICTSSAHPQLQPIEDISSSATPIPPPKCRVRRPDFPTFNLTVAAEHDLAQFGPFDIINCAHKVSIARYAISTMQRFASLAAEDSLLGPEGSPFGFKGFFKTRANVATVHQILTAIVEGTPPYEAGCYPNARPAVLCVNTNDVIPDAMRAACKNGHPAFMNVASPHVVFLCPSVWDLPDVRERNVKCPGLDGAGKLTPNTGLLATNTQGVLIHEFAHIYRGVEDRGDEKYAIQDAVELDESASVLNAANFALYVAAVVKRCRTWPKK